MKISKELAHVLLVESQSFRTEVLDRLFVLEDENRETILAEMHSVCARKGKIPAIKFIRGKDKNLMDKCFPEMEFVFCGHTLSLKSAKDFVEFFTQKT